MLGWMAVAAMLGGCANEDDPELSGACQAGPEPFAAALQDARGAVALPDGTSLSECVRDAREASQLQELGIALTRVADRLAARAPSDATAALQLGYLVGAVREGASTTEGIALELERRITGTSAPMSRARPAIAAAYRRGLAAGARGG